MPLTLPLRFFTRLVALGLAAQLATVPGPASAAGPSVDAYRGAGAWVDIYSKRELARPEAVVAGLAARGVRTLYLETANHRRGRSQLIVHPAADERFIDAAHAHGMRVVAWYLPGLRDLDADLDRALAAIDFETAAGERFDGFALDIESTMVHPIARRNAALLVLSADLRAAVGSTVALGAIVPDDLSTICRRCLWPGFPYRAVGRLYDVFLPMTYSTFRGRGARFVGAYIRANIARVRRLTGRSGAPVHPIGGLADGLGASEAAAVVAAALAKRALGVSFYNVGRSGPEEWAALRAFTPPGRAGQER
jgi:hypothetical protein